MECWDRVIRLGVSLACELTVARQFAIGALWPETRIGWPVGKVKPRQLGLIVEMTFEPALEKVPLIYPRNPSRLRTESSGSRDLKKPRRKIRILWLRPETPQTAQRRQSKGAERISEA